MSAVAPERERAGRGGRLVIVLIVLGGAALLAALAAAWLAGLGLQGPFEERAL